MVDVNEVKGAARNIGGKIQDAVGGLTGDASVQAKGKMNQVSGRTQQTFGAAAEEIREAITSKPLTAFAAFGAACLAIGFFARK